MKKKLLWAMGLLLTAFLFRSWIFEMIPFHYDHVSLPALLIALVGGVLAFGAAYGAIIMLNLRAVWQVAAIIIFSSTFSSHMGHWLGAMPSIGEFWGGFTHGVIETSILWGALYAAKEVWKEK